MKATWIGLSFPKCYDPAYVFLCDSLSLNVDNFSYINYLKCTTPINEDRDVDFIIMHRYGENKRLLKNFDKVKALKVLLVADPCIDLLSDIEFAERYKFDLLLAFYWGDGIAEEYKRRTKIPIEWLPLSTDVDLLKAERKRTYDCFLSGCINPYIYPLRTKIYYYLKDSKLKCFLNPIINDESRLVSKGFPWKPYFKKMQQSKILPFGSPQLHYNCYYWQYPISKYFNAMACETLVVANKPTDAKALHFIPNHNFVEVNESNFKEKITYYLENEKERKHIVRNARKTVEKYHSSSIRGKQLMKIIEKHLNNRKDIIKGRLK